MFSSKPRIFRPIALCAIVATLGQLPAGAPAQPAAKPPLATNPVGVEKLDVTITGVEGIVQYRTPPAAWKPCTVGLVLDEGVELRTGLKSAVRFKIPPDQTITLDRLGVVKVVQAIRDHGKVTTDVGMPHGGRVRLDIEAADVQHQTSIRSPNSTLAVTGTIVSHEDQAPFAPHSISLTGRANFTSAKGKTAFGGKGAGKTQVSAGQTAAEYQLANAVVDPSVRYARTPEETALVANLLSEGSVFSIANRNAIPVVHGGTPPMTDAQLLPLLPGKLDFVLRWTGNANLDLIVGTQAHGGEVMLPASGANRTPSGGRIPFDHQGGANGGIEIGYWFNKFPTGIDNVAVLNASGASTPFTLDVFENKQRITILDPASHAVTSYSGTAGIGSSTLVAALVDSGPNEPFVSKSINTGNSASSNPTSGASKPKLTNPSSTAQHTPASAANPGVARPGKR